MILCGFALMQGDRDASCEMLEEIIAAPSDDPYAFGSVARPSSIPAPEPTGQP